MVAKRVAMTHFLMVCVILEVIKIAYPLITMLLCSVIARAFTQKKKTPRKKCSKDTLQLLLCTLPAF
jgi:hypothetical protein